jgi:adenylate kinase family enzyme
MKNRIHILGASGSGTTTLGKALSHALPHVHLDSDDFFWAQKFTESRPPEERLRLLKQDMQPCPQWILSGSLCSWGDALKSEFDLVIFLSVPHELRMERLRARERERYGDDILPGGCRYDDYRKFMDWAARYDEAGPEIRSRALHEQWMLDLTCPVLRLEGELTVEQRVERSMNCIMT